MLICRLAMTGAAVIASGQRAIMRRGSRDGRPRKRTMGGTVTRRDRDAMVGAAVLIAGALVLAAVYGKAATNGSGGGYLLTARFRHAGGLAVGSAVRISGRKVGQVVGERLDKQYRAVVSLHLTDPLSLPDDTSAAIQTDGLLGAKYIELQPGADDAVLKPGGEILYTQDSITIQRLLEMVIDQARVKRGYVGKPLPRQM
jgi:phospholipid/cholesterol/gamma-HCH transport system substrate-binding protein